jgi:hypothetical protein
LVQICSYRTTSVTLTPGRHNSWQPLYDAPARTARPATAPKCDARALLRSQPPSTSFLTPAKWVQVTEAAILEGGHLPTTEAKRHTLADLIDRYLTDVLPHKSQSSMYMQTLQLRWWRVRLGHCLKSRTTASRFMLGYNGDVKVRSHATHGI